MSHLPGLGKEWINGPGFIKWLEQVRPMDMKRTCTDGGNDGGRNSWCEEKDARALYRAEHESQTISLEVADRLCVKLGLHIDTEMPADLWVDKVPRGKKGGRPDSKAATKAKRLFREGKGPQRVAQLTGLSVRQCYRLYSERPGYEGLTYVPGDPAYFERAA